jgi:hypothetical protein
MVSHRNLAALLVLAACNTDLGQRLGTAAEAEPGEPDVADVVQPGTALDDRQVDYNAALRTASLKLVDRLPTIDQIRRVQYAVDPELAYHDVLDELFADEAHVRRMIRFWRDTLKQGGGDRESAPVFAARVMVEGRPYGELFTATSDTCPSYDGAFVSGDCDNGVPEHAGLLTNPGSMSQFWGNMAFRRVRWVQETFVCSKMPAELRDQPVTMGEGKYTSPWPFGSVSNAPIDFLATDSVVCANCHTTLNHVAPLFGQFDYYGVWGEEPGVYTPTAPDVLPTERWHWLPDSEETAWREGVPVASLPELGAVLAVDDDVRQCLVARLWNFAMSKDDIVTSRATVPREVVAPFVAELAATGDLGGVLQSILASEDFTSF